MISTPTESSKGHRAALLGGLVFAVIIAACGGGSGGDPIVQVATLHIFEGSVEVGLDGAFAAGTEGQTLIEGNTVRTGADGRAAIEYFDGSVTRLDTGTSFTIVTLEILGNDQNSTVIEGNQDSGNTYNRVEELTDSASRFDIDTPTATASVQGTTYAVVFNADGSITIAVFEGTVIVSSDGEQIEVPAGFMVTVDADGNIGELVPIPDELLQSDWLLFNQCELDDIGECEVEAVLDHIEITPQDSTIAAGESQSYTIEAFDENDQSMGDVTADAVITGTGCAGDTCAPTVPGEYEISASFMDLTDTAALTVEAGPVDSIEISPEAATVVAGASQPYAAEAFDEFGNPIGPVDAAYSMIGGTCDGSSCSSEDVGDYTVTGTFEGASDTATLEVTVGPLSFIIVSPAAATIEAGETQGYSARGYDAFGNPRGAVAAAFDIEDGDCDGIECGSTVAGEHTVTGTFSGRSDTAVLTVTPGPIDEIVISPQFATIEAGETQAYTAEGFDEYGNSIGPVDAEYSILPSVGFDDPILLGLGEPGAAARYWGNGGGYGCDGNECGAISAGFYRVEGTSGGFGDFADLEVVAGPASDIELYPFIQELAYCDSETFYAYIVDQYGNVVDSDATVKFEDTDGDDENITYGEGGRFVDANNGEAIIEIFGDEAGGLPGPVSLQASAGSLFSNVIEFDVVYDEGCGGQIGWLLPFGRPGGPGHLPGILGVIAALALAVVSTRPSRSAPRLAA